MRYRVELSPAAQRSLRGITPPFRRRIETAIYGLADNPYPHGSLKLRGEKHTWRVRIGRFRIIYDVHADMLVIVILKVGPRNEATYRR